MSVFLLDSCTYPIFLIRYPHKQVSLRIIMWHLIVASCMVQHSQLAESTYVILYYGYYIHRVPLSQVQRECTTDLVYTAGPEVFEIQQSPTVTFFGTFKNIPGFSHQNSLAVGCAYVSSNRALNLWATSFVNSHYWSLICRFSGKPIKNVQHHHGKFSQHSTVIGNP